MNGKKTGKFLFLLLLVSLVTIVMPLVQAQEMNNTTGEESQTFQREEGEIVDLTGWKIFFNWVNFGILMYILHRFLTKPVLEFLDKRKEEIQSNLKHSEKAREDADKILAEYREKMANARREAMEVMEKAKKRGAEKEKELYAEAREKAREMLEEARSEIRGEVEKARKELVSDVGQLSVKIASSIIEKEIDEQLNEEFIRKQVEKFGDSR